MVDEAKDGGQAFPCAGLSGLPNDNFINPGFGMTLRDYFAGAALTGVLANWYANNRGGMTPGEASKAAYKFADSMLRERQL